MSDRIAVMNAGRIEQIGTPADIYERPATRFVAEFIGRMNLFSGQVTPSRGVRTARGLEIAGTGAGRRSRRAPPCTSPSGPSARACCRDKPANGLALRGTLRQVLYLGATREFHVDLDGGERGIVETPNDGTRAALEPGAVGVASRAPVRRELPRAARLSCGSGRGSDHARSCGREDRALRHDRHARPRASCAACAAGTSRRRTASRNAARSGCPTAAHRRRAIDGDRRTRGCVAKSFR